MGLGVAANDAEAVLRSLPTVLLRYQAHDAATRALARWSQTRAEFAQVLHPALPDSPGHADWRVLCQPGEADVPGRAAGLLSVIFKPEYGQALIDAFCDALKLFKIGYSWGGPISLVVPYDLADMRSRWPAHLAQGTLVRFAIGLEAVDDLKADLARALEAMGS
jgi:cystathionine beta-lyase